MLKFTAFGIAALVVLGLTSAILMAANAPAYEPAPMPNPFEADAIGHDEETTSGRLVLSFEPATMRIDRN